MGAFRFFVMFLFLIYFFSFFTDPSAIVQSLSQPLSSFSSSSLQSSTYGSSTEPLRQEGQP